MGIHRSRDADPKRGVANFKPSGDPSMGRKNIENSKEIIGIHRSRGADPKRGVANFKPRVNPSMWP